jgi:hypothetical protein
MGAHPAPAPDTNGRGPRDRDRDRRRRHRGPAPRTGDLLGDRPAWGGARGGRPGSPLLGPRDDRHRAARHRDQLLLLRPSRCSWVLVGVAPVSEGGSLRAVAGVGVRGRPPARGASPDRARSTRSACAARDRVLGSGSDRERTAVRVSNGPMPIRRLRELDVVRIVRLLVSSRRFTGTPSVMRAPHVGDIGTICHVFPSEMRPR